MFDHLPRAPQEFYNSVLLESLTALRFNVLLDNYDKEANDALHNGADRSTFFNTSLHAFYLDWFFRSREKLFEAYSQLGEDASKRLFLHIIAYRIGGHLSVRLPLDFPNRPQDLERLRAAERITESRIETGGILGNLKHYDFEFEGEHYRIDCAGLDYYLHRRQYFFQRDGVTVRPEKGDFVIDGGACFGDTAVVFSNAVGAGGRVFSFDPVSEHVDILRFNIAQFAHTNVTDMPYGISDHHVDAPLMILNEYNPAFRADTATLPLRSLDELVSSGEIPRVDYIKLDVEGGELAALKGAMDTIWRFKPKLAISLYHNPDDLFELTLFVRDKFPFYRLHIDQYAIDYGEIVLYAAPPA